MFPQANVQPWDLISVTEFDAPAETIMQSNYLHTRPNDKDLNDLVIAGGCITQSARAQVNSDASMLVMTNEANADTATRRSQSRAAERTCIQVAVCSLAPVDRISSLLQSTYSRSQWLLGPAIHLLSRKLPQVAAIHARVAIDCADIAADDRLGRTCILILFNVAAWRVPRTIRLPSTLDYRLRVGDQLRFIFIDAPTPLQDSYRLMVGDEVAIESRDDDKIRRGDLQQGRGLIIHPTAN